MVAREARGVGLRRGETPTRSLHTFTCILPSSSVREHLYRESPWCITLDPYSPSSSRRVSVSAVFAGFCVCVITCFGGKCGCGLLHFMSRFGDAFVIWSTSRLSVWRIYWMPLQYNIANRIGSITSETIICFFALRSHGFECLWHWISFHIHILYIFNMSYIIVFWLSLFDPIIVRIYILLVY